jgi:hypothetical protein
MFYGAEKRPQYGALHLNDSYFRLNAGPSCGWGTSVILLPVFWSSTNCPPPGLCQGGAIEVIHQIVGSDLVLSTRGTIGGLRVASKVYLRAPKGDSITAEITTSLDGEVHLDLRPGEAYKPVMLSSMNISSAVWDAQAAFVDKRTFWLPSSGWIMQPPILAEMFGLRGGRSTWNANAPTVEVRLDRPMLITGWVTPSTDPNDDNVGLWAASTEILRNWRLRITVIDAGMKWLHQKPY